MEARTHSSPIIKRILSKINEEDFKRARLRMGKLTKQYELKKLISKFLKKIK